MKSARQQAKPSGRSTAPSGSRSDGPGGFPSSGPSGSLTNGAGSGTVQLRLYVAGQTPKSVAALSNLKHICMSLLDGRFEIEVIDLMKNPQLARGDQILAIPTLVRSLPRPIRKIIGDLSDTDRVLVGLELRNIQIGQVAGKSKAAGA